METQAKRKRKAIQNIGAGAFVVLVLIQLPFLFTNPVPMYRFFALIASGCGLAVILAASILSRWYQSKEKPPRRSADPS